MSSNCSNELETNLIHLSIGIFAYRFWHNLSTILNNVGKGNIFERASISCSFWRCLKRGKNYCWNQSSGDGIILLVMAIVQKCSHYYFNVFRGYIFSFCNVIGDYDEGPHQKKCLLEGRQASIKIIYFDGILPRSHRTFWFSLWRQKNCRDANFQ